MTIAEMIAKVKLRTKQVNDAAIIQELQTAYDWAHNRIFNTATGPNLFFVADEELIIGLITRDYDLAANLQYPILAIKRLWLMLPGESGFTPMENADSNQMEFAVNDSQVTGNTNVLALGHPVFYDVTDFNQVRFAPALPPGATVRADYYRLAPGVNDAGDQLSAADDLPSVAHEAVTAKATSLVFDNMDDDRSPSWEVRAERFLNDALYVVNRRVQGPTVTQPFRRAGRGRFI